VTKTNNTSHVQRVILKSDPYHVFNSVSFLLYLWFV